MGPRMGAGQAHFHPGLLSSTAAVHLQVLITVLFNGGASSYLLNHWNLFDAAGQESPTEGNSLAVLVPQTSDDLDSDAHPNRSNLSLIHI